MAPPLRRLALLRSTTIFGPITPAATPAWPPTARTPPTISATTSPEPLRQARWLQEVTALSAEQQVEAVAANLKELSLRSPLAFESGFRHSLGILPGETAAASWVILIEQDNGSSQRLSVDRNQWPLSWTERNRCREPSATCSSRH